MLVDCRARGIIAAMYVILKVIVMLLLLTSLLLVLAAVWLWPRYSYLPAVPAGFTAPVEVLRPRMPWEGSELPPLSSLRGEIDMASHELRAPFLLRDRDGRMYLYYVGGGEKAIGVASLAMD